MKTENIILCFCKQPDAGLVKSRLAQDLGDKNAAKIYRILLDKTLSNVHLTKIKTYLYCYPNTNHSVLRQYGTKFNFELRAQSNGDLGNKMYQAINHHLNENKNVVLIGTDCLEINSSYIKEAFNRLNTGNDIVLGPTEDGGYALIGLSKVDESIFENITWSTDQVFQYTQQKITNLGWKYATLSRVRDLDTLEDYRYFSTHEKYQYLFN